MDRPLTAADVFADLPHPADTDTAPPEDEPAEYPRNAGARRTNATGHTSTPGQGYGDDTPADRHDAGEDEPLDVTAPPVLSPDALHGLAGDMVRTLAPHTEADPAALLVTFLAYFGAIVGNGPHVLISNDRHPACLWPIIVGKTAAGAKGTSLSIIRHLMGRAAPEFAANVATGLSSGEGLIDRLRDGNGNDPDASDFDEGVLDKRLLVCETEFSSVLTRSRREGSTLSEVMRNAWDQEPLQTISRAKNALRATGYHAVILGHITPTELAHAIRPTDVRNGLMNRFVLVHSHRSQLLPAGGNVPADVLDTLAARVTDALHAADTTRTYARTTDAETLWAELYPRLCRDGPDDTLAALSSRARAQVPRLSLAYALLDGAHAINLDHLAAGYAVWQYCEDTARWLFASTGRDAAQKDTDRLLEFIAAAGTAGVTQTDIRERLFQRNKRAAEVRRLLEPLKHSGRITETSRPTAGRASTVYTLRTRKDTDR